MSYEQSFLKIYHLPVRFRIQSLTLQSKHSFVRIVQAYWMPLGAGKKILRVRHFRTEQNVENDWGEVATLTRGGSYRKKVPVSAEVALTLIGDCNCEPILKRRLDLDHIWKIIEETRLGVPVLYAVCQLEHAPADFDPIEDFKRRYDFISLGEKDNSDHTAFQEFLYLNNLSDYFSLIE